MVGRHQNYSYKESGLNNVVLLGVLVYNCQCGEIAVQIPAMSFLHRLIAFELLKKPTLLSGEEVRFLRRFTGASATEFADTIGSTKVSVSRWENGAARITRNTDRLLRLAFFTKIVQQDAEAAIGLDEGASCTPAIIAFAKKVKTFDLPSFLKKIRDVQDDSMIKIDPAKLAEFEISDGPLSAGESRLVQ